MSWIVFRKERGREEDGSMCKNKVVWVWFLYIFFIWISLWSMTKEYLENFESRSSYEVHGDVRSKDFWKSLLNFGFLGFFRWSFMWLFFGDFQLFYTFFIRKLLMAQPYGWNLSKFVCISGVKWGKISKFLKWAKFFFL